MTENARSENYTSVAGMIETALKGPVRNPSLLIRQELPNIPVAAPSALGMCPQYHRSAIVHQLPQETGLTSTSGLSASTRRLLSRLLADGNSAPSTKGLAPRTSPLRLAVTGQGLP